MLTELEVCFITRERDTQTTHIIKLVSYFKFKSNALCGGVGSNPNAVTM